MNCQAFFYWADTKTAKSTQIFFLFFGKHSKPLSVLSNTFLKGKA